MSLNLSLIWQVWLIWPGLLPKRGYKRVPKSVRSETALLAPGLTLVLAGAGTSRGVQGVVARVGVR